MSAGDWFIQSIAAAYFVYIHCFLTGHIKSFVIIYLFYFNSDNKKRFCAVQKVSLSAHVRTVSNIKRKSWHNRYRLFLCSFFSYFLLASTPDRTHSAASVTVIRQPVTEKLFILYNSCMGEIVAAAREIPKTRSRALRLSFAAARIAAISKTQVRSAVIPGGKFA